MNGRCFHWAMRHSRGLHPSYRLLLLACAKLCEPAGVARFRFNELASWLGWTLQATEKGLQYLQSRAELRIEDDPQGGSRLTAIALGFVPEDQIQDRLRAASVARFEFRENIEGEVEPSVESGPEKVQDRAEVPALSGKVEEPSSSPASFEKVQEVTKFPPNEAPILATISVGGEERHFSSVPLSGKMQDVSEFSPKHPPVLEVLPKSPLLNLPQNDDVGGSGKCNSDVVEDGFSKDKDSSQRSFSEEDSSHVRATRERTGPKNAVEAAFDAYLAGRRDFSKRKGMRPGPPPTLSEKRRNILRRRIKDYGLAKVCAALRGIFLSDFHTGDNDRGKQYLELELALRESETHNNVEKFAELYFRQEARRKQDLLKAHMTRKNRHGGLGIAGGMRFCAFRNANVPAGQFLDWEAAKLQYEKPDWWSEEVEPWP